MRLNMRFNVSFKQLFNLRFNLIFALALTVFLILSSQFSVSAVVESYDYPYAQDPMLATISSALMKADNKVKAIPRQWESITINYARRNVPVMGQRSNLDFLFYPQGKSAPLMVMVAGIGGSANTSYVNYYSEKFYRMGFHVLAMPSPYFWNFSLSSSQTGYPGITSDDAKDLYYATQKAMAYILRTYPQNKFERKGFFAASLGALEGAYLSEVDRTEKQINFDRIMLVNPPVNLVRGTQVLDQMFVESYMALGADKVKTLQERIFAEGYNIIVNLDIKDPNYFLNLDKRIPLSTVEKNLLVSASLRDFLPDTIFVSQQIKDLGILKGAVRWDSPGERGEDAKRFSLSEYLEKFLLLDFRARRNNDKLTIQDIGAESNFTPELAAKIKENPKVFLMHNADDFLITSEDLELLKSTFGPDRSYIFPSGGHIGNLWYAPNQKIILDLFEPLKYY